MTTVDQRRLMVAIHEMGHALTWHRAGFQIKTIRVRGRSNGTTGYVDLDNQPNRTPEEARDYLIGLLAGREAEHEWCRITGQSSDAYGSSTDLAIYRRYRKYDCANERWVAHLSDGEFRAAARKVINARWSQVVHLANQLAQHGRIRL